MPYSDPYNETNRKQRLEAEAASDPRLFFNKKGNPFLGFMRFLRRVPVKKEPIDEKALLSDFSSIASDKIKEGIFVIIITIIAGVLWVLLRFNLISKDIMTVVGLFFMASLIGVTYYFKRKDKKSNRKYTLDDYKNYVIESALSDEVEELVYEPYFGIPQSVFEDLNVMQMGNRYSSTDLITAKYHGVYFAQTNIKIEDCDRENTVYFNGRWIIIDYPKKFSGKVTIFSKKGYGFCNTKKDKKLENIELENTEFNKIFETSASDQQLAYYLLTPQLMEKLMYINQSLNNALILCFKDGVLYVGINNIGGVFAPNYEKKDLNYDINKLRSDFMLISSFIEIMKIDNNVYVG